MLMKLGGSVLVTASCAGLGIMKARNFRQHKKNLEQLRSMMVLLRGEILYARAPLAEAFWSVGNREEGPAACLFRETAARMQKQEGEPFFQIWQEESGRYGRQLLLTDRERLELQELGRHLGFLDLGMQERTIALYLERAEQSIRYYREHEREQNRLYTGLGIMGGLFLSILLC